MRSLRIRQIIAVLLTFLMITAAAPVASFAADNTVPYLNRYWNSTDEKVVEEEATAVNPLTTFPLMQEGEHWYYVGTDKTYETRVTATFTCEHGDDEQTVTARVTEVQTPDATCAADGVMVHTATAAFEGKTYTDVKEVRIPAAGHSYGEPVWTWEADHSAATATFACGKGDDTQTVTKTATQVEVSAATATADQVVKYTVTVEFDGRTYAAETEDITVPGTATGDQGQSDTPSGPDAPSQNGKCKWCGEDHSGSFWQRIVGFFHSILYFFAHLFGLR